MNLGDLVYLRDVPEEDQELCFQLCKVMPNCRGFVLQRLVGIRVYFKNKNATLEQPCSYVTSYDCL